MGWPDSGLAFDVALHLGTLAAVAFAVLARLGAAHRRRPPRASLAGRPFADPDAPAPLYLALATVPGAVAGQAPRRLGGDGRSARRPSWR